MEPIEFLTRLTTGAIIGWFSSQMVKREHRQNHKAMPDEDRSSEKREA